MPSANAASTPIGFDIPQVEGRYTELEDWTVGFETYKQDLDVSPWFKGLPHDHCQAPHWGYVKRGKLTFTFEDGHSETYVEGDAYYVGPGHVPTFSADSEAVEFSRTDELNETISVVEANLTAAGLV